MMRTPEQRSVVVDEVAKRKAYPSDRTDEPWALMQTVIPEPKAGGCPPSVDMRELPQVWWSPS